MNKKIFVLLGAAALMISACSGGLIPDPEEKSTDDVATIVETYREAANKTLNYRGPITSNFYFEFEDDVESRNVSFDVDSGRGYIFKEGQSITKFTPQTETTTKCVRHYYPTVAGRDSNYDSIYYYSYGDLAECFDDFRYQFLDASPDYLFVAKDYPKLSAFALTSCWCDEISSRAIFEYVDGAFSCVMYEREDAKHIVFTGEFELNVSGYDEDECTVKYSYAGLAIIGEYVNYIHYDANYALFEDDEMYYSSEQVFHLTFEPTFNQEAYDAIEDYETEYTSKVFDRFYVQFHLNDADFCSMEYECGQTYSREQIYDLVRSHFGDESVVPDGIYADPELKNPISGIPENHILPNYSTDIYIKAKAATHYSYISTHLTSEWYNPFVSNHHFSDEEMAIIKGFVNYDIYERSIEARCVVKEIGSTFKLDELLYFGPYSTYDLYLNDKPLKYYSFTVNEADYRITGEREYYETDAYEFDAAVNLDIQSVNRGDMSHDYAMFNPTYGSRFFAKAYVSGNFTNYELSAGLFYSETILQEGDALSYDNPVTTFSYHFEFYNDSYEEIIKLDGSYEGFVYVALIRSDWDSIPNDSYYLHVNF